MNETLKEIIKPIYLLVFKIINNIYILFFKRIYKKFPYNKLVDNIEGERILVLAPHIDDEMIGCGGALMCYAEHNKKASIVYLTNSCKQGSYNNLGDNINERKIEALDVTRVLKVDRNDIYFLGADDGKLYSSNIGNKLESIIDKLKPDTIFLPCLIDTHVDHYAITKILYDIYQNNLSIFNNVKFILYESQSPFSTKYCNLSLNITKKFHDKYNILKLFKSQPTDFKFDYDMCKFNGLYYGNKVLCENYISTSPELYFQFYKKYFFDLDSFIELKSKLRPNGHSATLLRSYHSSLKNKGVLMELINNVD